MDCGPPGSSVHGESPGKNIAVGLVCSLPGDLPNPGIEPRSPTLQADSLPSQPPGKSWLILGAAFGTRGNKELICSWGKHPSWQVHLESLMGLVRLAPFWRMRSRVLECQDAAHQVPLPSLWFSHANLLLCVLLPSWKLWLTRHSSWSSWSLRCPALPRKHIGHFLPVLTALATGPTFAHPPRSSPSPVSPDPCSALLWVSYQSKPCMALLSCPCLCFQPHHLTFFALLSALNVRTCRAPILLCPGVFCSPICLPDVQMSIHTVSPAPFLAGRRSRCFSPCPLTVLCT